MLNTIEVKIFIPNLTNERLEKANDLIQTFVDELSRNSLNDTRAIIEKIIYTQL